MVYVNSKIPGWRTALCYWVRYTWVRPTKWVQSASSPVVPVEFWRDVSCKACWEKSPRTPSNKQQIRNCTARPSVWLQPIKNRQPHFISTIYSAPQMFVSDVFNLYIRNIPWSSQKIADFRWAISGTFSRWHGTFLPFLCQVFTLLCLVPSLPLSIG